MPGDVIKCPHCQGPLLDEPIGRTYVCGRCRRCVTEPLRWMRRSVVATTLPAPRDSAEALVYIPPNPSPKLTDPPAEGTVIPFGWSDHEVLMVIYRHLQPEGGLHIQPDIPRGVEAAARASLPQDLSDDERVLVAQCVAEEPTPRMTLTRRRLSWHYPHSQGQLAWSEITPGAVAVYSGALHVGGTPITDVPERAQTPLANLIRHLAALAMAST